MTQQPLLTYPCKYPIKVVGEATALFESEVLAVARHHDPSLHDESIARRHSRQGKYLSLTLTLTAQDEAQIKSLLRALNGLESVHLVL